MISSGIKRRHFDNAMNTKRCYHFTRLPSIVRRSRIGSEADTKRGPSGYVRQTISEDAACARFSILSLELDVAADTVPNEHDLPLRLDLQEGTDH